MIDRRGEEPYPVCENWEVDLKAERALVDIPRDIAALKVRDLKAAQRWRKATREIFRAYFTAGFTAVALLEKENRFRYLLLKADLPRGTFPPRAME